MHTQKRDAWAQHLRRVFAACRRNGTTPIISLDSIIAPH
jgi:hypothetical protein